MQILSFTRNKETMDSNICLAKSGDKDAFLALLAENELPLYRVARGMLQDVHDIEDAIQNTIIKAYRNIGGLKYNEYFRTWLIRILINECNHILKHNRKTVAYDSVIETGYEMDGIGKMDLTNAVNSLREDLRIVTVLFYFEDMSIREISKILHIPEGTVKSRLSKSRQILNDVLKED